MAEREAGLLANPHLRLAIFGGKGGAGKTTSAVATSLHIAHTQPGRRILLVSTDPAHSLSDSLACPIGGEITGIPGVPGLDALSLDTARLLAEFNAENEAVMRAIADRGTYFDREDIANFFELSLPGMDEVMAILKISSLIRDGRYDLVILDTAPAGHTIRLLSLPDHMTEWVRVMDLMLEKHRYMSRRFRGRYVPDEADHFLGTLAADLNRVRELLRNTDTTEFVPVVNPEAMSLCETDTLLAALEAGQVPVRSVILNRLMLVGAHPCPFCEMRQANQAPYLAEIKARFAQCNVVIMPLFPTEVRGMDALGQYAELLFMPDEEARLRRASAARAPCITIQDDGWLAPSNDLNALLDHPFELILFGGKGGVGKTTLAAVTALAFAHRAPTNKTLLFSTDPACSLASSLDCEVGFTPTHVPGTENLYAVQVDVAAGMAALQQRYSDEITEVFRGFLGGNLDIAYDREVMLELLSLIPPGVDELIALTSLMDMLEEGAYGRFILDTSPTGHMLRFLELPGLAMNWFRTFFRLLVKYQGVVSLARTAQMVYDLFRSVKRVRAYLMDPQKTEFVAVTIPEAMGVFETNRFMSSLDDMSIPCRHLIFNMVVPPSTCGFCQTKRTEQISYIDQMRAQYPQYEISLAPLLAHEVHGVPALQEIADIIYPTVTALQGSTLRGAG